MYIKIDAIKAQDAKINICEIIAYVQSQKVLDLFRLMDCEKITKNTFFLCIFTHSFQLSTSFFG